MHTITTSVRIPADLVAQYDALAETTGRQREYLIIDAMREYLAAEQEDLHLTQEAMASADRGELVDDAIVNERMATWLEDRGVSTTVALPVGSVPRLWRGSSRSRSAPGLEPVNRASSESKHRFLGEVRL
jgi:RHH-type transcriptional regulator, rel operon repressor / antitoxin RelB